MTIKSWPEQERPREKLLYQGANSLSDAELVAIFLRTGTRGMHAVELARHLLKQFSSLRGLLSASSQELCQIKGCGSSKYVQLQAALEMGKRYLQESLRRDSVLKNPAATKAYLTSQLRDRSQEIFAVLFLDSQNQVIAYEELFFGTINGTSVHPREVVKRALQHNAAAVILAHNHPSGITNASDCDKQITADLQQALALVDTKVLDHFIIGEGEALSFAARGYLEKKT